ncbi:hypothetical protein DPV78_012672 [Talaromyces pinophilus]|nr:hypothetical protein DPV78_012672 [Talaromyces pinophilus]
MAAISFTLLFATNGILAFISSGRRTYEAKVSTILRTTRDVPLVDRSMHRHLDEDVEEEQMGVVQIHDKDRDGKSPLPSYLGGAEIQDDAEEMDLREARR